MHCYLLLRQFFDSTVDFLLRTNQSKGCFLYSKRVFVIRIRDYLRFTVRRVWSLLFLIWIYRSYNGVMVGQDWLFVAFCRRFFLMKLEIARFIFWEHLWSGEGLIGHSDGLGQTRVMRVLVIGLSIKGEMRCEMMFGEVGAAWGKSYYVLSLKKSIL